MARAGDRPTISVILPVFNGEETLPRCLEALRRSTFASWEGIVVDDGCTDHSVTLARAAGYHVVATAQPRSGPAQARNVGALAARGDILFFVDADVAVQPDILERVASRFAAESDLAACFGSYDDVPADTGFLSQYKNLFHHYVHQQAREDASTFWSGCGAIRRDVFLGICGFDTTYGRPSIEDIDLGYRLRRAGYRIRLDKGLQVTHLKRWTVRSLLQSDVLDRGIPWTRLILRTRGWPNDLNLQVSTRVSVFAAYLWAMALFLGFWQQASWAIAASLAILVIALNWPLYRFFARKRGLGFALRAIPWHWLYLYYSGFSFAIGLLQHWLDRARRRPAPTPFLRRTAVMSEQSVTISTTTGNSLTPTL